MFNRVSKRIMGLYVCLEVPYSRRSLSFSIAIYISSSMSSSREKYEDDSNRRTSKLGK